MAETKAMQVLKNGILLEKKGQAFYSKVSSDTNSNVLKDFFDTMAKQEAMHLKFLSEQYSIYQETKCFGKIQYPVNEESFAVSDVITKEVIEAIGAASFEAAAISAAMIMEDNAIKMYATRAAEAEDSEEKALYTWLSEWEKGHLAFLSELDRMITEEIWFDNNFWPF